MSCTSIIHSFMQFDSRDLLLCSFARSG
jgi:hypothetical protein